MALAFSPQFRYSGRTVPIAQAASSLGTAIELCHLAYATGSAEARCVTCELHPVWRNGQDHPYFVKHISDDRAFKLHQRAVRISAQIRIKSVRFGHNASLTDEPKNMLETKANSLVYTTDTFDLQPEAPVATTLCHMWSPLICAPRLNSTTSKSLLTCERATTRTG